MSVPVRSMTGFARVQKSTPAGDVVVTLKSLNHRGLDIHFHTSSGLDPFENALRAVIKRSVARGHVDVRVSFTQPGREGMGLNEPLLTAYVAAFRAAAKRHGIENAALDLNRAFQVPGMIEGVAAGEVDESLGPVLVEVLEEALAILNGFRAREGSELAAFVRKHNRAITEACAEVEQIRSRAMPLFQQRLSERLKDILRNNTIDPQRLAQEAALLADRSDIGEEVARLKIHSNQLEQILAAGGEVGKRLDFLLQEMNREANTILSKTSGIGELGLKITDLALASKADIEKIREQALNLE